jgi:hypothetical protein
MQMQTLHQLMCNQPRACPICRRELRAKRTMEMHGMMSGNCSQANILSFGQVSKLVLTLRDLAECRVTNRAEYKDYDE